MKETAEMGENYLLFHLKESPLVTTSHPFNITGSHFFFNIKIFSFKCENV